MRTIASNMNFTNSHIISKLNICHSTMLMYTNMKFAYRNLSSHSGMLAARQKNKNISRILNTSQTYLIYLQKV